MKTVSKFGALLSAMAAPLLAKAPVSIPHPVLAGPPNKRTRRAKPKKDRSAVKAARKQRVTAGRK